MFYANGMKYGEIGNPECKGLGEPLTLDRQAALWQWRRDHGEDDHREHAILEAATIAKVVVTEEGPVFDPEGFTDLVSFIADMPF